MPSDDPFDLQRFVAAQDRVYETVLAELRAGRKRSHWMWFVFPQASGLGRSQMSEFYGIDSLEEARAYLAHPVLGARLRECVDIVIHSEETSLAALFGAPDDAKFRSSMTLFALASGDDASPFGHALERFCEGTFDPRTVESMRV